LRRIKKRSRGALTFEWVLLITVLAIGIVGGLSAVRDAVIDELGDVVGAATAIDQSYTVNASGCADLGNAFQFTDLPPGCSSRVRTMISPTNQGAVGTCDSGP